LLPRPDSLLWLPSWLCPSPLSWQSPPLSPSLPLSWWLSSGGRGVGTVGGVVTGVGTGAGIGFGFRPRGGFVGFAGFGL
jgi:hypothetical protein